MICTDRLAFDFAKRGAAGGTSRVVPAAWQQDLAPALLTSQSLNAIAGSVKTGATALAMQEWLASIGADERLTTEAAAQALIVASGVDR